VIKAGEILVTNHMGGHWEELLVQFQATSYECRVSHPKALGTP